jgi:hypothetical protein
MQRLSQIMDSSLAPDVHAPHFKFVRKQAPPSMAAACCWHSSAAGPKPQLGQVVLVNSAEVAVFCFKRGQA